MPRTTIAPVAASSARRPRIDSPGTNESGSDATGSPAVGAEAVAGAADGLDRVAPERPVDLLAQVADVDVDDVRRPLEREVPHVLEDRGAAEHRALVAQEQFEQRELARGQRDRLLTPADPPRRGIQP